MSLVTFEDLPSTNTPINSNNLNNNFDELNNKHIRYTEIRNLSLGPNDTYQLTLPEGFMFLEPLIASNGNQYSGGQFVTPGNYSYIINNDLNAVDKGIWVMLNYQGLVSISNYKHCGAIVRGFRIWYFG